MTSIYGYFDIHEYLRAEFEERKGRNPRYSYRAMAAKLGLNSGTMARIMNGERNVSSNLVPRLAALFGLRSKETEYLEQLAALGRARDERARLRAYRALVDLRNGRTNTVTERQHVFYEEWYYSAVRELLRFYPFHGDYHRLAKMLEPSITVHEAKRAVRVLREQGLIERINGAYVVKHNNISTGAKWHGMAVHRYQETTTDLARKALDRVPRPERDFSTMTMCYSSQGMKRAREVLKRTREELSSIEEADKERNRVYQVNMHLFPLSGPYTGEES
jgi:uncharacterized protein (TIGR02147 family)